MSREDLRPVQYTVTEKTKAKKGKKSGTKKVKKVGYFHLWGSNADKKGKEKFFGLVEEATGKLLEVGYKDIKFLTEEQIDNLYVAAVEEADIHEIIEEATEATAEEEKA